METIETKQARNAELLARRLARFNARDGARVGDFIRLPRVHRHHVEFTRITHDWGDKLQTGGGTHGAYFMCRSGFMSYSGSLDAGIASAQIVPTDETRNGSLWFFDQDQSGAGRGVYFSAPMRVFAVREGADLSGLDELRCPFHLTCLDKRAHAQTCGYWFTITHRATSHTAFATVEELTAWLAKNGLVPSRPLPAEPKTFATIPLYYSDDIRA
jgi:hypothetical protein